MNTDYMTSTATLPPYLAYPRFLLGMELKLITKVVYAVLLDAAAHSQTVDKHGRLYVVLPVADIAQAIDRTQATVRNAINELEGEGLVERMPTSYKAPARIYVKLPSGEDMK